MNNQVYEFCSLKLTDEQKLSYCREAYRRMIKDALFAKDAEKFGLGKDADKDDRFLFLFLCMAMKDLSSESYDYIASYIYYLRGINFRLKISPKNGVIIAPEITKWQNPGDTPATGKQNFLDAWAVCPKEWKDWMQEVFASIPESFSSMSIVA